jgi:diguanylate cyclase (GGDEF)-like protein/PAS domain S-box-containing protein
VLQHILLIQNDPADAEAVRQALSKSSDGPFQVEWVRRCSEGLERLVTEIRTDNGTKRIAAVLTDLSLPDSTGLDTFDRLFLAAPEVPILILCSAHDEEIAKLAVQRGAQDYLLKGLAYGYVLPKALLNMVERAAHAEALFAEQERAQVTLNSIGDAVMSTDVFGRVTYLNGVAESMTGWSRKEAEGRAVEEVFQIIDVGTRAAARNPMALAIRENKTVGLTANCVLIRRDGFEAGIEDSAAPIHDRRGQVTGAVMVFHDVSMARAMTVRMSHLAQHDSLTELPNRLLFNDRLTQALALALRNHKKLAVLFLDLDRFKLINDSMGHDIGDRLLQSVAHRMLTCVRSSDTVSRQGGDEFVILLPEITHSQDAELCAEKMLSSLRVRHDIGPHGLYVTGSIGIATFPDDAADGATLLKHADAAMYDAKEHGRDSYQFFRLDLDTRAVERQALEGGLRQAVERNELVLHYQPIVNLSTESIVGVEALVRWRSQDGGFMAPSDFIPTAEECGIVVSVGRWVLREACHQARAWQKLGFPPIRIAVNVSAVELRHKDYVAGVQDILREAGLEPRFLELELTETSLMQDSESIALVLHALKRLGVQLSLDDFGTGYSSLSHLKRFPINTLKIDHSFVRDLGDDAQDDAIVRAVIGMGKALHIRIVAEGVETAEQLAVLQKHRCPEGQGNFFQAAGVAADISRLLSQRTHDFRVAVA